jgi:carboxymethylenebutenolidase
MKLTFKFISGIALMGLFIAAIAARASSVKKETVQFKSGDDTVSGFLAEPESPGKHPALVVIHEWWGLNDWVKEQAEKFAEQGYVALAVDLYRGKTATDSDTAHQLMRGMPQDRAVRDMQAAFSYLAALPEVNPNHIGDVGWCMGGGLALQLAIHQPHLAACVVNYGALPTDPNDLSQIYAPVLGNFGADDHGITPDDVHAFEKFMRARGRLLNVKIYDGAGHAFENPSNTNGYRPEAAADALKRTIDFLNALLKEPARAK